jgi:fumarylpyruvate hydrolase
MSKIFIGPERESLAVQTAFCMGRNYPAHAKEMGATGPVEPVVFIKPGTAVVGGTEPIVLPPFSNEIHHEIELIVLVDAVPRNVSPDRAPDYVLGYGVGLDLTARDLQTDAIKNGLPWTISKGFDRSAPVSDFVRSGDTALSPKTPLRLTVNNEIRQQSTLDKMILSVDKIISHLSTFFSLQRGDLIFTGTPEGVGPLRPGDEITAELVGVVSFSTRVQK